MTALQYRSRISVGEQPRFYIMAAGRFWPCKGGMNMVTFEALTCMFTLGLLIVAILTSKQDK